MKVKCYKLELDALELESLRELVRLKRKSSLNDEQTTSNQFPNLKHVMHKEVKKYSNLLRILDHPEVKRS